VIVRCWHVAIDSPKLAVYESCLDAAERARAGSFRLDDDRKRFVAARVALRHALGEAGDTAPEEVSFRYLPAGKPEHAAPGSPWQFNVAHSGRRAIVALAHGRRIGVDIELIGRTYAELRDLASSFAQAERDELDALPPHAATRKFYRSWVRDEAVLKALGAGFSQPLQTSAVDLRQWQIVDIDQPEFVPENYVAALAVEGESARIIHQRWP